MVAYAMIGAGRVGRNISAYLRYLGHDVAMVSGNTARNDADAVGCAVTDADIVALAMPDAAIEPWVHHWRNKTVGKTVIHFSGALTISGAHAFHPLFSFPHSELCVATMKRIVFACSSSNVPFHTAFPGAPNLSFVLPDNQRALYHALAVLTGNFPAFIWNELAPKISSMSGIAPKDILGPYLQSVVDRFLETPTDSMTGPIARRDGKTVDANLAALEQAPEHHALYRSFCDLAWPDRRR